MNNQQQKPEVAELTDLAEVGISSVSDIGAAETGEMTVWLNGRPTSWKWIWAGPGHPRTVAQRERDSRKNLNETADLRQKQLNSRKIKIEPPTPGEDLTDGINKLLDRLLGWKDIKINGKVLEFSTETARAILANPANHGPDGIYLQCWQFLGAADSFTKSSATTSAPSPSEASASTSS